MTKDKKEGISLKEMLTHLYPEASKEEIEKVHQRFFDKYNKGDDYYTFSFDPENKKMLLINKFDNTIANSND